MITDDLSGLVRAKSQMRKKALESRMSMDNEDWLDRCERIQSCFLDLFEESTFGIVHLYTAMLLRNEIDTETLAIRLLRTGKQVAVPVMSFENRSLSHFLVTEQTLWRTNRWGVTEPINGEPVNPDAFELIVVPMVAADVRCNRLGYGKGYYDTFLAETKALTVGLCFECCLFDDIPCEPHDVRLNHVITEQRFLTASG